MPRGHLVLSVALMTAALAVIPARGQQREPLAALAEKVCQLGNPEKDQFFEPLGLKAPFRFVGEPTESGIAVSASACANMLPSADTPFLGIRHLVDATAPGESVFMDYFIISGSSELIAGLRHNLTAALLIRPDIAAPEWQQRARDLEAYWLNKYGLQGR